MLARALNGLATRLDPSLILDDIGAVEGFDPDPWQRSVLRSKSKRIQICCHRQAGKSTATAGLAIHTALYDAPALILLISRSQRQAGELFAKATRFYRILGEPVPTVTDRADTLALTNGSRIVSLPNSPDTIVGFSGPKLIVIDEAARVPDAMFAEVSPMLLQSGGRQVELSTPFGKRGHFYRIWDEEPEGWEQHEFRASQNPKLDPAFLAGELRDYGQRWYNQNYECSFEDTEDQVFPGEMIESAFGSDPSFFGDEP